MRPIDRILSLCEERGVKQSHISSMIGGYRGKVTDWKNNKSSPSEDDLRIIAAYFDVTVDYLLGRTEHPRAVADEPDFIRLSELSLRDQGEATPVHTRVVQSLGATGPITALLSALVERSAAHKKLLDATKDLSDEEAAKVQEYAEFIKQQRNNKPTGQN